MIQEFVQKQTLRLAANNPSVLNEKGSKQAQDIISKRSQKKADDKTSQKDDDIKSQLGSIYSDKFKIQKGINLNDKNMADIMEEEVTQEDESFHKKSLEGKGVKINKQPVYSKVNFINKNTNRDKGSYSRA